MTQPCKARQGDDVIRFLAKIAAQHALSPPILRPVYTFAQHHLTRSIVVDPQGVRQKVEVGLMYLDRTEAAGLPSLLTAGPILDYGAGSFLGIPLLYARLGAREQIAVDVARSAREPIVYHVIREMNRVSLAPRPARLLPEPGGQELGDYLESLCIRYEAPITMRLPLSAESIATVLCTQVLQYPARASVRVIFAEAARVLRPGGIFLATIHLYDPYWPFDRSLSRFNFLRYSKSTWERWFNSALMAYNRLRASDFRDLLQNLPLEPIVWDATPAAAADLEELNRIKVHPEFADYECPDLACPDLFFVLRKT
jgi:SAM-dependent methyltransferase